MLRERQAGSNFSWKDLGDIEGGRPNLGPMTTVAVYRLMQFTMRAVLVGRYGAGKADELLYEAGHLAGTEFCRNVLNTGSGFDAFIADLREKLETFAVGILRFEKTDVGKMDFTLTMSEDLDCSGLPVTGETVCVYDEGFIAGVLETYTAKEFEVKEVDCWATGARICRFRAAPKP
jgi:predicted hydrocarbon binding protein